MVTRICDILREERIIFEHSVTTARPRISCLDSINWFASASSKLPMLLRFSSTGSFLIFASNAFCADMAKILRESNPNSRAVFLICFWISASTSTSDSSPSHRISILFSTTSLCAARFCTYSAQICMSDFVMPVSVAVKNSTACAFGMMLSVSSGSAPIVFRPGVSITTKPFLSNG